MKRFKKLLSMMLAIVMVVGAVNLPAKEVKAATDVNLTLSSKAPSDNFTRYNLYFTGLTNANFGGSDSYQKLSKIYVDGVAKSHTDLGFWPYAENSLLCVPYDIIEDGVTANANFAGEHTLWIKAGTAIGDNVVASDIIIKVNKNVITDVSANAVTMTLGNKAPSDNFTRYNLYFNGLTTTNFGGSGSYQKLSKIYVDGVEKSHTDLGFWPYAENSLLCVPYGIIEDGVTANANFTAEHTLWIKAGTEIGNNILANDIMIKVNKNVVTDVSSNLVELTYTSGAASDTFTRYDMNFTGLSSAEFGSTSYQKLSEIYIDGVAKSHGDLGFWPNDTGSLLCVPYAIIEDGITANANFTKEHNIWIKAGTTVGSLIIANDIMVQVNKNTMTDVSSDFEDYIPDDSGDSATSVTFAISQATDSEKLYLTTSNIPYDGINVARDTRFEAVDDSSVFKFNNADISVQPKFAFGGLYLTISEVTSSAQSQATTGDTITIGGLWKHLYDNVYYDFGDPKTYKWNGSNWIEYVPVDAITPTLSINGSSHKNALILSVAEIAVPSGDTPFTAYDNRVLTYYDASTNTTTPYSGNLNMSKWGGIYIDPMGEDSESAGTGDTITLGGVWKYTGDSKYYDFGEGVSYRWNGATWIEVVEINAITPTLSINGRSHKNALILSVAEIAVPSGDTPFSVYENTVWTYYDASTGTTTSYTGKLNMSKYGGIYVDPMGEDAASAGAGDIITIGGIWQYTGDNRYYDFGEGVSYKWNGSSWSEYVKPDYYTPTLAGGTNTDVNGVYLTCDDDMPTGLTYTAKDTESGVWVDGTRTAISLRKSAAGKWYVDLSAASKTAERGTKVAVKGTFVNGENEITFAETAYIYDGAKWCTGSALDTDFTITGMGSSTYEAGLGWKLRFETDSVVFGEDFATDLGTYTIQVDGVNTQVNCTSTGAPGYGLGILVEDLAEYPQGTTVTVPAGQIGEYKLTNTYEIIYDAGEWKLAHETHPVTLSFSHKMGTTKNIIFRHSEDLTALLTKGQTFKASYADSGIYVNGVKAEDAGIFWWTETDETTGEITSSYFVVEHDVIAPNRGDIVTVKGTFNLGDIYLNFSEASGRFVSDTSWVTSCNYESVHQIFVTDIASGAWQEEFSRWLFTAATSTPIEHDSAEFTTPFSPKELIITITDKDGKATTLYEQLAYNAKNATGSAEDYLGFFITTDQGLPQDPTGWSITIEPSYLQTTEKTYKIMSSFTYKYDSDTGFWKVDSEREKPASGVFADANGDGTFNAADYVAVLKEYNDIMIDGKKYLCAPDALIAGKTTVQLSDTIRIREELLDRGSSAETYVPVYLDDETIQLGAYKGPRAISEDRRYDDNGNQLTAGTDYTKTDFLTDEMFKWYADAGLNTLIAEGDAPFNSEGTYGLQAAAGYWTNLVSYMEKAKKYDLDVYVTSGLVNAYLRDGSTSTATNTGSETTITPTTADMQNDLKEMLTGAGSESHPTSGLLAFDNFKGVMLADELYERYLPNYLAANQYLATIAPDIEVTSAALSSNAVGMKDSVGKLITSDYETYAKNYAQYSMNKNFVYDFYPYQGDATRSGYFWNYQYDYDPDNAKTDDTWLDKLEASAERAAEGGWTTGIAVQSFAMDHHSEHKVWRSPENKRDIGFQIYTGLAYGMKNFNYFTYWEHDRQSSANEVHTNSMVYIDSNNQPQKTKIYDAVQAVNKEITQFDHVFLDYDWQSTMYIGSSDLFGSLTQGSSSRIASKSATQAAIIGCMYDEQKDLDGFWIVNATIPEDNLSNTVTVTFNNATRAMVFNPATGTYGDIINLTNGTYTATLASGEGQFVIPLP